jgi:flagellar protein FliL
VVENNEIIEAEASPVGIDGQSGSAAKVKILVIVGGLLIFLIVLVVLLFVTPLGKSLFGSHDASKSEAKTETKKTEAEKPKAIDPKNLAFIAIPDILVNLRTKSGKGKFLKISLTLELENAHDKDLIDGLKPRIIDQFQIFLRELEMEDLTGSGALERLRHELLARVNNTCAPVKVADVLFKEMLVQ